MDSIPGYGLDISRYFFLSGTSPYPYMKSVNACLYLSTDKDEVRTAVSEGHPAGYVLPCAAEDDELDTQLRIAFDFDGILVDDEAEQQYAKGGLDLFRHHEIEHSARPLKDGPLMPLLQKISNIQKIERENPQQINDRDKAVRVAIVTARNAPAHERMMNTLKYQGIEVDELFLTGGIEKKNILDVLRPQIFSMTSLVILNPRQVVLHASIFRSAFGIFLLRRNENVAFSGSYLRKSKAWYLEEGAASRCALSSLTTPPPADKPRHPSP